MSWGWHNLFQIGGLQPALEVLALYVLFDETRMLFVLLQHEKGYSSLMQGQSPHSVRGLLKGLYGVHLRCSTCFPLMTTAYDT